MGPKKKKKTGIPRGKARKLIKMTIHYGGSMKQDLDGNYNYLGELGCKRVSWKVCEIIWSKFEELMVCLLISAPIHMIWYKEVTDVPLVGGPMLCLMDKEYDFEKKGEDGGYEADAENKGEVETDFGEDEKMVEEIGVGDEDYEEGEGNVDTDEEDMPPKEVDDPEESEDERHVAEEEKVGETEVDDGEDVVLDTGDGGQSITTLDLGNSLESSPGFTRHGQSPGS